MPIYRSDVRDPLPGVKEWADTLDLTRRGLEFVGPCPLCGTARSDPSSTLPLL